MISLCRDPTGDFALTEVGASSEAGISQSMNRVETESKQNRMELRIAELEQIVQTYEVNSDCFLYSLVITLPCISHIIVTSWQHEQ